MAIEEFKEKRRAERDDSTEIYNRLIFSDEAIGAHSVNQATSVTATGDSGGKYFASKRGERWLLDDED